MSLHLHPVENAGPTPLPHIDTVFFVIQRDNGHWSAAARIIFVCDSADDAERFAQRQKKLHPHQHFGIAKLHAEIHIIDSLQIIRTPEGDA
jgi:hypothetical protein